jgi:two-component system nitrate/nitrite sensor histidine kinase NarX
MLSMKGIPGKLGAKINGILLLFFLVALATIMATLYVGRQLEGGAAAINEAGSQRMRAYRIAYLLEQSVREHEKRAALRAEAQEVLDAFEHALGLLEAGDADRPLFLPREAAVREGMQHVRGHWENEMRPVMLDALQSQNLAVDPVLLQRLDVAVRGFVSTINDLVLLVEKSNARHTDLMWIYQNALVGLAMLGTLLLTLVLNAMVISPVKQLERGMARMAEGDFDARLRVETRDELGDLARGFNRMAEHLRGLYDTLEQRVADKTRDIEGRNRELAVLYDIAAYLAEPAELSTVCRGVLEKLRNLLGAESGAVRTVNMKTQELEMMASINLSERFLSCENRLGLGSCLCGEGAAKGESVVNFVPHRDGLLPHCYREGLNSMVAIPIKMKNQNLGQFNLFFIGQRLLTQDEVNLLEAVGRHMAVAIENRRLAIRETDMAVSEERNLLAQELHDSIAQSLAFLNIQAQMLQGSLQSGKTANAQEELARMREGIQESYDNVRELLVHFRIRVEHADLEAAVRSALDKFESQTDIRTHFEKTGTGEITEASSILQILHILQEALSNVRKHAQASAVQVHMHCEGKDLRIRLCDDGRGFAPDGVVEEGGAHVGIGIMRARASRIGARFDLEAQEGQGTCVTLALHHG